MASVLTAGGPAAQWIRAVDWTNTDVGPISDWPEALRTSVSICLKSSYPILVMWGDSLVHIYNESFRPILGLKHPAAMGADACDVWPEIWETVGPMLSGVLLTGEEVHHEDLELYIDRNGFPEETHFSFSYSPIWDKQGPAGVICICSEITGQVVAARRLRALADLASGLLSARGPEDAVARAAIALAPAGADIPSFAVYGLDSPDGPARLITASGGMELPATLGESGTDLGFGRVLGYDPFEVVDMPKGWSGSCPSDRVALIRLDNLHGTPIAVAVAAISPSLPLDEQYEGFLRMLGRHLATGMAQAAAAEAERARADALAELDRAKSDFFSGVSHEFRTPLTLIGGPIREALLDGDDPLPDPHRDRLVIAARNVDRLSKLVDSLLDLTTCELGPDRFHFEPTDLGTLTGDLAAGFRSAAASAGIDYHVHCPPCRTPAYVDPERWERIVLNLLSNALKYTFDGQISVTLSEHEDSFILQVSDTGIGIPAADLPLIFDRFHRVQSAQSRSIEGSGIGLAVVRELVGVHGGEVQVASEPERGTTFTVTVPAGHAHLPQGSLARSATAARIRTNPGAYVEAALPTASPRAAASAVDSKPARILVVEDNIDMQVYLTHLLSDHWNVDVAPDGASALTLIAQRRPDLVISDVMMPTMDGITLLRELKAQPGTQPVPVILLSARAGQDSLLEALAAGASDYIVKPFAAADILARVRIHLELARSRAEAVASAIRADEEARARRDLVRFETLASTTTDLVAFSDASGSIHYINRAGRELLGIADDFDLSKLELADLFAMGDRRRFSVDAVSEAVENGVWNGKSSLVNITSGRPIPVSLVVVAHRDSDGVVNLIALTARDVSTEHRVTEQLRMMAERDPLTGLYNRRHFNALLHSEAASSRSGGVGALLLIDLDNFKYVNDSLGHPEGDRLIRRAAQRLSGRLRDTDTLGRLGGDEFGVLLPGTDAAGATLVATDLLRSLRQETAKGRTGSAALTASIGIATYGPDRPDVNGDALLRQADMAMYESKESGRNSVTVYDPTGTSMSQMEKRWRWADRLRDALDSGRLQAHAQQILSLHGQQRTYYELLARIETGDGIMVSPAEFLESAECFDLVQDLDRYMIRAAIGATARAKVAGSDLFLGINLSAKSLLDADLPGFIEAELAHHRTDGSRLAFEITETTAVVNFDAVNSFAAHMRKFGSTVALDDFGAGYCSFHYLKHLVFDMIKIDGEFVKGLAVNPADQLIVEAAVGIARGLGKTTVAEWVEEEETAHMLDDLGVDYLQGYFISVPRPLEDVLAGLAHSN